VTPPTTPTLPGRHVRRLTALGRGVLLVLILAAGPLAALLAPPHQATMLAVVIEISCILLVVSWYLYATLRRRLRLGTMTSMLVISMSWAILYALLALTSPRCPGFDQTTSCSPRQIAANALVGLLLPLVPAALLLPVRRLVLFAIRLARRLHAQRHH
jgi:hypothetical protein